MDARALQLSAYAAAIDALRATSNPGSPQVIKLLRQLRHTFKVSEQRHAAEVRRACADERFEGFKSYQILVILSFFLNSENHNIENSNKFKNKKH